MTSPDDAPGARFRALHAQVFIMPNPFDAASARILEALGFPALATSSAAAAERRGRRDYQLTREEALADAREIVGAVAVPVSADLENGFGDAPEAVAETIRLAAACGLAGCSIEDAPGDGEPYPIELATERVRAAVAAVRTLPHPFVLTARAENHARDRPNLEDTIRRLRAYAEAGADVLFAPGVSTLPDIERLCREVPGAINVVGSSGGHTVAQLASVGVRRISVAASLFRCAMTAVRDAGREILESGTFSYAHRSLNAQQLGELLHAERRNA